MQKQQFNWDKVRFHTKSTHFKNQNDNAIIYIISTWATKYKTCHFKGLHMLCVTHVPDTTLNEHSVPHQACL